MTNRKPLLPRRDDDPARLAELRAAGKDADMNPLDASELEREANRHIKEPPVSDPVAVAAPATSIIPVVPPKVAKWCGYVAAALGLAGGTIVGATSLPIWVGFVVFAIAAVCGFISGAGLPSFFPGRPLVSAALAAKLVAIGAFIAEYAHFLPSEPKWILAAAGLVVAILFALAGKMAPQMIAVQTSGQPGTGPGR